MSYIVCQDGKPVEMELADDIIGGLSICDPTPVFDSAEDAEQAALSYRSLFGDKATFEIRHVKLVIGDIHRTAAYDAGFELDEDE